MLPIKNTKILLFYYKTILDITFKFKFRYFYNKINEIHVFIYVEI